MPFVVNAKALSVAGHSLADASLRFVFLACKNLSVDYASNGTSVNRIRENGCGFLCIARVTLEVGCLRDNNDIIQSSETTRRLGMDIPPTKSVAMPRFLHRVRYLT